MATFDLTTSLGVSVNSSTATFGRNKSRKSRLLQNYTSTFMSANSLIFFTVDNIPTTHLQEIKKSVANHYPGQARFVFGKNTLYKRAIKSTNEPKLAQLLPLIKGNIACLSCSEHVNPIQVMKLIEQSSIQVAAKPGMIINEDLMLPKTLTQLTPEKTSFFSVAGIHTKITKGKIEIAKERILTPKGSEINETACKVLELLQMKPIRFDMKVKILYEDGELMDVGLIRSIESTFKTGMNKILNIQNWITGASEASDVTVEQESKLEVAVGDKEVDAGDDGVMFGIFGEEEEEEDEFGYYRGGYTD